MSLMKPSAPQTTPTGRRHTNASPVEENIVEAKLIPTFIKVSYRTQEAFKVTGVKRGGGGGFMTSVKTREV